MLQDISAQYRSGVLNITGNGLELNGTSVAPVAAPGPGDHGLAAWNFDAATASAAVTPAKGTLYLMALYLRVPTTVSKLWLGVAAAAVTPTAGESNVGLFSQSGTQLGYANIDSLMTPADTPEGIALTATSTGSLTSLAPGLYYAAFEVQAATAPSFLASAADSTSVNKLLNNVNLSTNTLRFATNGAAMTALPSSVNTSSNTTTNSVPFWVALS